MYAYIKYYLLLLSFSTLFIDASYGQQVTREQLLKLFYKANSAQRANNPQTAIATYTEILKLSPGLPDPYLQLGNLYVTMTDDTEALKKACICYSSYLKLKPEAANASTLKNRIVELMKRVEDLERKNLTIAIDTVLATKEVPRVVDSVVVAVAPQTESETTLSQIASDTISAAAPSSRVSSIDSRLLGRWASSMVGDNGREMWIIDILQKDNEMWMLFNDNSYVKNELLLKGVHKWDAKAYEDGDTLVFTFKLEQKKEKKESKRSLLGDFGAVVSELFDASWNSLTGGNTAVAHTVAADTTVVDSIVDSLNIREPQIIQTYEFRLKYDGYKLCGTLRNKVVERALRERELADEKHICELFRAPSGYNGFSYTPISEELKSTKQEFRILLNQKTQESAENTSALNDLGCMYASGVGIRKNMKMAVAYLMEAAMKNNMFGMLNMAQLYREGMGVEKDMEKARDFYHRAYDAGYTDAMVLCGDTYLEGTADTEPDYQNALVCYQKAVFRRCPYASYRLGWLYHEGLGVTVDLAKAWNYYQQACAMQYPDAMTDVGTFYRDGILVEKDYTKSLEYFGKAAAKGNARAMYELSQMYLRGLGVEPDFELSKEWLSKSMKADDRVIEGFNTVKSKINAILYPIQ